LEELDIRYNKISPRKRKEIEAAWKEGRGTTSGLAVNY